MTERRLGSERSAATPLAEATEERPLPVLIVAAYPSVRAGLTALLATDPGLSPSASAFNVVDWGTADATWPAPSPAVIVVSAEGTSAASIDDLRDHFPGVPLVLLGEDLAAGDSGLGADPVAYLGADIDGPTLIAAVRAVGAGLTVIDPTFIGRSLQVPPYGDLPAASTVAPPGEPLTARERQVLELVAEGLPNKAIAHTLGISEHTAKFHVGSLLGKLDAGSRTEAVMIATRRGLLTV